MASSKASRRRKPRKVRGAPAAAARHLPRTAAVVQPAAAPSSASSSKGNVRAWASPLPLSNATVAVVFGLVLLPPLALTSFPVLVADGVPGVRPPADFWVLALIHGAILLPEQVVVEVLHTVYTCASFRKDAQARSLPVGLVHSFLASLMTTLAGSIVAAVVLLESPSFIRNWRTVVPYRLVIPWLVVYFLPASVFNVYVKTSAGTVPRAVVNAHEALNKHRGLIGAVQKATRFPLVTMLAFVAVRGAASSTAKALETVACHPVPGSVVWKHALGALLEHARYLALCAALLMASSDFHPARGVVSLVDSTVCLEATSGASLLRSVCDAISCDNVAKGTHALVLLYLLQFYVAKALPAGLTSNLAQLLAPSSAAKLKTV